MTVLVVAEAVVIVLLAILVGSLMRANTALRTGSPGRAPDAPVGSSGADVAVRPAPDIAGVAVDGSVIGITLAQSGQQALVAFMSTTCATCNHFWERFADAAARATLGETELIVVTHGAEYERPAEVAAVAPPGVPLVMSSLAWRRYAAPGSPWFVVVDGTEGRIVGEGSATNWDELLELVAAAAANRVEPG